MNSARVATGYFGVGDHILYGKWKNKKGIVVRLYSDDRGVPMVEIEPVPKGRKKNKTFSLFKIWHAKDSKGKDEVSEKEASELLRTLTSAKALVKLARTGETTVKGTVRIHEYADHFKVWDLTNAGKRGKSCDTMSSGPKLMGSTDAREWMHVNALVLQGFRSFKEVLSYFKELVDEDPDRVYLEQGKVRGIDVLPATAKKIDLEWKDGTTEMSFVSLPFEFRFKTSYLFENQGEKKDNTFRQDTLYFEADKKGPPIVYSWAVANEDKIKGMSAQEFLSAIRELGVRYDTY